MALTGKRLAFADAVLAGKSNRDAAIAAGYSVKTASAAGSRLVKDKDVAAHLKKAGGGLATRTKGGAPAGVKSKDAPRDWPFGTEPPKPVAPTQPEAPQAPVKLLTGEDYLRQVVNDATEDSKLRVEAAKKLIDFERAKPAPMGKKDGRLAEAKEIGKTSRFAASAPPKLAAANGKRI